MGNSSVEYEVNVYDGKSQAKTTLKTDKKVLFTTKITFVNVGENGDNAPIVK